MSGTYRIEQSFGIIFLIVLIAGFAGWVMNLAKLIGADVLTGMEIARGVGVVAAPLGSILGYF